MGIPVVVATNGFGRPVKPVGENAPLMTVATNGFGEPIVISDLGQPFVVEGLGPSAPTLNGGSLAVEDTQPEPETAPTLTGGSLTIA